MSIANSYNAPLLKRSNFIGGMDPAFAQDITDGKWTSNDPQSVANRQEKYESLRETIKETDDPTAKAEMERQLKAMEDLNQQQGLQAQQQASDCASFTKQQIGKLFEIRKKIAGSATYTAMMITGGYYAESRNIDRVLSALQGALKHGMKPVTPDDKGIATLDDLSSRSSSKLPIVPPSVAANMTTNQYQQYKLNLENMIGEYAKVAENAAETTQIRKMWNDSVGDSAMSVLDSMHSGNGFNYAA